MLGKSTDSIIFFGLGFVFLTRAGFVSAVDGEDPTVLLCVLLAAATIGIGAWRLMILGIGIDSGSLIGSPYLYLPRMTHCEVLSEYRVNDWIICTVAILSFAKPPRYQIVRTKKALPKEFRIRWDGYIEKLLSRKEAEAVAEVSAA